MPRNVIGTNRILGNAIRTVIDGAPVADFEAPLVNNLNMRFGRGVATFTRASTATVTDFEGLLKTAKSGEARFEGARRVENLLSSSEDFSNAAWVKVATATVTGTNTINTPGVSDRVYQIVNLGYTAPIGDAFVISANLSGTGTVSFFSERSGGGTYEAVSKIVTLTSTPTRYSLLFTFAYSGHTQITVQIGRNSGGETATQFTANKVQIENVTGEANQNPSEYVSTGVLTSAPYHGANVDGVKYFTTENGNTVASNVVTEATGTAIPDATLKGYVAEGSRTNLLTYSEQFDNAAWAKINSSTVTPNTATAPNGTLTADTWARTLASVSYMYQVVSKATSPLTYTYSAFVKPNTGRYCGIILQGVYPNAVRAVFDLQTGTISSSANVVGTFTSPSATIATALNGFYRVTLTGTSDSSTGITPYVSFNSNGVNADGTDSSATSSGFIYGAQLEQASFASSYIPTTTASVTRDGDVLTYPKSGNFDNTKGSAYFELYTPNWSTLTNGGRYLGVGTSTEGFGTGGSLIGTELRMQDGTNAPVKSGLLDTKTGIRKRGGIWSGSTLSIHGDGLTPTAGTFDGDIGTATTIGIGIQGNGAGNSAYGTIRNVKIWKKALTDEQLIGLTS